MLIYPDTRDLINLVKGIPVSVGELQKILNAKDSRLVLSFENVSEIVVVDDAPETRRRLRLLNTLPIAYMMSLTMLRCLELATAAEVYDSGKTTTARPSPFVKYWEETFGYPHNRVLGYSLTDVVMQLLHNDPKQFRKMQNETDFMASAVKEDRDVNGRERRSAERFIGGIREGLRRCRIRVADATKFALSVNENPSRCPGIWFFDRVYLEYAGNVTAAVDRGDYMDLSHATRVPYVDALTLDRRMKTYTEQAIRGLSTQHPEVDYSGRLFPDLAEILKVLG